MKLIITESQNKEVLKSMVKKIGWKTVSDLLGGPKVLAEVVFNNDPMEYLNMFNDLDVVQSEENSDLTLFRYEKGNNIMIYRRDSNSVYINSDIISFRSFLPKGFYVRSPHNEELIEKWLREVYNLNDVVNFWPLFDYDTWFNQLV